MLSLSFPSAISDKPMQLNEGRFMQNGKCGYVLMPDCMFEPGFNPLDVLTHVNVEPVTLTIQVSSVPYQSQVPDTGFEWLSQYLMTLQIHF